MTVNTVQPFEAISAETMEAIHKAAQSGINIGSGIYGYDLSGVVSLVPVVTPTYERIARRGAPVGSDAATWRALLNVNNSQPNPFVGRDAGGNYVQISEHDVSTKYQPVRVSGSVTQDAMDFARNYADAKALASVQTLMQWRILDDKAILGGQACALPAIGTVTCTSAATGGTIAASQAFYVKCSAKSMMNIYWGGGGVVSASATTTTATGTATNTVTATVPAVRGACGYDWWTSTDNATWYYAGTTVVNTATFTAVLAAAAAVPTTIPDLYSVAPSNTPRAADTSYSTNAYNGILSTLSSDYSAAGPLVQYGTGDAVSGASWTSLDGATLTASAQGIAELDALNEAIYSAANVSPTVYLVSAKQASDLASKILATNQAVTYLQPEAGRVGITGGASMARYINRVTGDIIAVVTEPHVPQGTIIALSERVPFPNSNIANTLEVRTNREVAQFDYAATLTAGAAASGPRFIWDQSSIECLVNRAPVACGWLSNIAAG